MILLRKSEKSSGGVSGVEALERMPVSPVELAASLLKFQMTGSGSEHANNMLSTLAATNRAFRVSTLRPL